MHKRHKHSSSGFTLIEIMSVLLIMTVLFGIVIAAISSSRLASRDGERIADISQIRLALEQYYDACGQYPQTLTVGANSGCVGGTTFGTFLIEIPNDPLGSPYYYYPIRPSTSSPGDPCFTYHVGATLETPNHGALSSNEDDDYAPSTTPTRCVAGGAFQPGTDPLYDGTPGL